MFSNIIPTYFYKTCKNCILCFIGKNLKLILFLEINKYKNFSLDRLYNKLKKDGIFMKTNVEHIEALPFSVHVLLKFAFSILYVIFLF